ncbi:hypothetical protein SAMN04488523_11910 [Sulfitobacter brevis]|uniref:Uncharacterized protein n=1 Tax=Sulfitobacter brevis TaxID=74348 RepID=A0A1I2G1K8_9RHOB|nr:hypothetical protein SAMN04488523_11910 [Sulfitobacter brevis]
MERSRKNLYGSMYNLPSEAIWRVAWPVHPSAYDYMNISSRCLTRIFHFNFKADAVSLINKCTGVFYGDVRPDLCLPNVSCDLNSIVSSFDGSTGLYKGVSNPYNTKASYEKRTARNYHHPERPAGHILLSIKVLSGLGLILCGLGGFNHTLAQSARLSVNASGQRSIFYCLIMLTGAYLIAANIHASGSPRCEDDYGNPSDYHTDSECF